MYNYIDLTDHFVETVVCYTSLTLASAKVTPTATFLEPGVVIHLIPVYKSYIAAKWFW